MTAQNEIPQHPGRPVLSIEMTLSGTLAEHCIMALSGALAERWIAAAERRGVPPVYLMADVMQAIARDDLFNAVLDDEDA